ncbi:FAD:protein FMN transferase [Cellulophaga omnivescoria]|uniref:FAD:protein FMN transferase n=1 Tax=Cellulophaga omnivescoria TaxID=1888890 RepID=UPI0022EFEAD7|nr:FAD:protein FMN transferase [Cellulophaga omnivescoria]WBU89797.1 FAD:protein FMN transferase [Cellulophaga omnivescoria]
MKKIIFPLFCFFVLLTVAQEKHITAHRTVKLMGNRFDFTIVAKETATANTYIDECIAEVKRIEKIISSWDAESQTTQVNKNAGIAPVKVAPELFGLVERAIQISKVTDGAFDITYAALDNVWKFNINMEYLPTDTQVANSIANVGYHNIVLDKEQQTIYLPKKGMKIGFGAIGKGFAADKVKELMVSKGVVGGIINASGDLTTWGTQVSGKKWLVGISNPLDAKKVFSWLPIVDSSVATSGNYEKYIIFKGEKYSHIIDPRTGWPSKGVKSVSIFAKKAELCDALATSIFVMGVETGMSVIEQLNGVEVIIVDKNNQIHKSKGITFQNNY